MQYNWVVLLYYPARAGLYKFRLFHSGNKPSLTEGKQVFYHTQASSDWPQSAQTLAVCCLKRPQRRNCHANHKLRQLRWFICMKPESELWISAALCMYCHITLSLSLSLPPLSLSLSLSPSLRWWEERSAALSLYKKCWTFNKGFYTATQEKRNDLPWSRSKMLDGHLLLGWLSFTVIVYLLNLPGPAAAYFG